MRIRRSKRLFEELEARFLASSDDAGPGRLATVVRASGSLTREQLLEVCRWKSPRALPLARRNTEKEVREATRWALGTDVERLRIGSLLLLQGVSWPTASVVLHFFHAEPYPILDVRAAWSLGMGSPSAYSFDYWHAYVETCRGLSRSLGLSMRTVDRALWQYSKERQ